MSETAGSRLARLLALVPWLLAHDGVSIAECADHFGVSEEQLERDLWLLVVCGTPGYGPDQLVDIQFWDDGRIHVLDPQTLDRALRLTQEEALTLLVALRMLAQLPGVDDRDAIASATAKIEQAASLSSGDSPAGSGRVVAIDVPTDPVIAEAIDAALVGGQALRIRYAAATRDELSTRTIEPLRLFTTDGRSYLEAFCTSAGAVRTFRLDRVVEAELTASTGTVTTGSPGRVDPAAEAVLALRPAARWIIDVYGGRVDDVAHGADETVVRVPLHSLDWGVRLVLSLTGEARVLEPPELAAAVAGAARSALGAYPDA